jgi:hypothetical protein
VVRRTRLPVGGASRQPVVASSGTLAIYFDTNSLKAEGWPRVSAGLRNLRDLAKFVGVRLFLPGPVETELEALWLREFESKRSAFKNLRTHAGRVFQVELTLALPSDAELLTAFRKAVADTKAELGIKTIPTTTRSVQDFVEMAAHRRAPFTDHDKGFPRRGDLLVDYRPCPFGEGRQVRTRLPRRCDQRGVPA